ncbi:MAG: dTMP kinase, partial [Idiomarina sp.]|nr:dTMP kinase [Idiomarina sp.]
RYLELAEQNPNTHIVNAEQPLAQVQQDIRTVMQRHLSLAR